MKKKNIVSNSPLNAGGHIKIGDETTVNHHHSIQQIQNNGGDNIAGNKNVYHGLFNSSNSKPTIVGIFLIGTVLVVGLAFFVLSIFDDSKNTSNVTIQARPMGNYELPKEGTVYLKYGGERIPRVIDKRGIASFPEVPNKYFGEDVDDINITFEDPQKEPFKAFNEDSSYLLKPNSTIDLWVELPGLDKISGIVIDEKGNPLKDASVHILNLETTTNKNGWFELNIPLAQQRKFHTVRVFKDGYQNRTYSKYAVQVDTEARIVLKK